MTRTCDWLQRDPKLEKKMIRDYLAGMTGKEVALKYGYRTEKTTYDVLRKHGIDRRAAKVATHYNEQVFSKINTHAKAYFLGLLLADGYVLKDYRGFGIQLSLGDKYILDLLAELIGPSTSIKRIKPTIGSLGKLKRNEMYRLIVTNSVIASDLRRHGLIKNKTYRLSLLPVEMRLLPSFVRGLWDGDGTIGVHSKNGNIWCQIGTASLDFVNTFLELELPVSFSINRPSEKFYHLRVSGGNQETIRFLKWMYARKGDLYLRRKYEKIKDQIC